MFFFFNFSSNATSNSSGRRAPRREAVSPVFADVSMEVLEMRQKIQFWVKKKKKKLFKMYWATLQDKVTSPNLYLFTFYKLIVV